MSGNRHVINQAAINEGALLAKTVSVVLSATAVLAATATYGLQSGVAFTTNAVISSAVNQTHALNQALPGIATGQNGGLVTKVASTSIVGDAEIDCVALGSIGGAEFSGGSDATAFAHFDFPTYSSPNATATFEIDADSTWFLHYAESIPNPYEYLYEQTAHFVADPSIQLNGESIHTHYVAADPRHSGRALVSFAPGAIELFSDAWLPFGGAEFTTTYNYTWRTHASVSGVASLWADPVDIFFCTADLSGAASSASASADKLAVATVNMDALAGIITPQGRIEHEVSSLADCTGVAFVAQPDTVKFGGYPMFNGTADLGGLPVMQRMASSDITGEITIGAEAFTWRIHQGATVATTGADFFAFGSMQGYDVFIFARAPQLKDFARAPENKDFIRVKT